MVEGLEIPDFGVEKLYFGVFRSRNAPGMVTEVENCRGIQRQLEDALHRVDLRLESVSSVAAQCSGGLADAKAVAEKVRGEALREAAIGRETTEQALKAVGRGSLGPRRPGAGGAQVLRAAGEAGGLAAAGF